MDYQNLQYSEWFINQKRIPDKESEEHKEFFDFHKEVCLNGCTLDGVYINPFLYWHLNFWHTEVDVIDEYGRISRIELSAKTGQGIEFLKEALVGRASAFNNQEIINYDENF